MAGMMRKPVHKWALIAGLSALFAAIYFYWQVPGVRDLKLISVKSATWADVPSPYGAPLNPKEPVLELTFETGTDLRALAAKYGLFLRYEAWICDKRDFELNYFPIMLDEHGDVRNYKVFADDKRQIQFWTYLFVRSDARTSEDRKQQFDAYDLATRPREVCIQMMGRNMALQGFSSNVVRVRSAVIVDALSRAQRRDPERISRQ